MFILLPALVAGDILSLMSLTFVLELVFGAGGGADVGGGTFDNLPKLLKDFCLRAVGD